MRSVQRSLVAICLLVLVQVVSAQKLPSEIRSYLDRNYKGWRLSPSRKDCGADVNAGFVSSDFSGDGKRDFAVKFIKGQKGYILAFVKMKRTFKPFVLHSYNAEEAEASSLGIWKKGTLFGYENRGLRLRHDAPSDFLCESDVGGIHYYRNGKFVGY